MRAGLTGLGLVFVATLSASVLFAPEAPTGPSAPSEPLAQLGVAPGPEKQTPATGAPERDAAAAANPPLMDGAQVPAPPAPGPMEREPQAPILPDAATLPALPHDDREIHI